MSPKPNPVRAERNLRNLIRFGPPAHVTVYGQDLVDILQALEEARAAASGSLDVQDPASALSMRAAVAAKGAGR